MARGNTEIKELFRGRALTNGGTTRFSQELPMGEGWYKMTLRFNHTITTGTATGPLTQGLLRIIRGITLRSDRGELFVNNTPGRLLYQIDSIKAGSAAALAAVANGLQSNILNIWFFDPLSQMPEDYLIDTSRYSALTLEVNYGTVADLYGTVGTATVATTLDCIIERHRGRLPDKIRPVFQLEYGVRVPVNPSSFTEIALERAANLVYKRLYLFASSANAVAGVPWSGDADDALISEFTLDHDQGRPFETILHVIENALNKQEYSLETAIAGLDIIDFTRDGSFQSSLFSGNKSRLSARWVNGSVGSSPLVSLGYEGFRPLQGRVGA
jgi:hypothetical protein